MALLNTNLDVCILFSPSMRSVYLIAFSVAQSVVNLNGDEILTSAALDSFYKECLLPVLDGVYQLDLLQNDAKLKDYSLLTSILH